MSNKKLVEFSGTRANLYKECLKEFPHARDEDISIMKKFLKPKQDETVLEIGAGRGFFSNILSNSVKKLIVSDPSKDQLEEVKNLNKKNIILIEAGADELKLNNTKVDAIWSFGAMHHCFNKTKAFQNFARVLKNGGRLVIGDVWNGSTLAKHFDDKVTKYCITGHEVAFWTDEFTESLCYLSGLQKPKIINVNIQWKFNTEKEIGTFLYKLHAMTRTTENECLKGAKEILGIEKKDGFYCLNWPMKIMTTIK